QWGGRIPRAEVSAAWAELNERYKIERAYCDPGFRDELSWESEIEAWDRAYGPKKFMPWSMSGSSRIGAVYEALRRFEADLTTHRITQDGCPVTRTHMMNARKVAKTLERYGLAKPQQNRKIRRRDQRARPRSRMRRASRRLGRSNTITLPDHRPEEY
ncbi:MAG: hypothetical protein ACLS6O_09680, partial [Bifidobacterium sp.]